MLSLKWRRLNHNITWAAVSQHHLDLSMLVECWAKSLNLYLKWMYITCVKRFCHWDFFRVTSDRTVHLALSFCNLQLTLWLILIPTENNRYLRVSRGFRNHHYLKVVLIKVIFMDRTVTTTAIRFRIFPELHCLTVDRSDWYRLLTFPFYHFNKLWNFKMTLLLYALGEGSYISRSTFTVEFHLLTLYLRVFGVFL